MFSMLAISYLFLGGAGAGMLVVLCVLECLNARRRFGHLSDRTRLGRTFAGRAMGHLRAEREKGSGGMRYYEGGYSREAAEAADGRWYRRAAARSFAFPADLFARAWLLCLVVLGLGALCLVADLGRPDHLLVLLSSPRLSVMAVGAYAFGAAILISAAFAAGANLDGVRARPSFVCALGVMGITIGLICAIYTGVLLSDLASVLFWQTWLLPLLFVLSSLSGGVALVFLAAAFVDVRQAMLRPIANLARIDGGLLVCELVCIFGYLVWGLTGVDTFASAQSLVAGEFAGLFWGGTITIGLVLPFIMEWFILHGNRSSQLLWIAAAVLFGGFLLRVCIVGAGSYDITQSAAVSYGLLAVASIV